MAVRELVTRSGLFLDNLSSRLRHSRVTAGHPGEGVRRSTQAARTTEGRGAPHREAALLGALTSQQVFALVLGGCASASRFQAGD